MNADATAAAAQVLSDARELEPRINPDESEACRFSRVSDRPLALAIETIIGHGAEDECGIDPDTDACWSRVDRWLATRSDDGFWVVEQFTDAGEASAKLAELTEGSEEA